MMETWHVEASGKCTSPGVDFSQSDPHLVGLNTKTRTMLIHEKGTKFWSGMGGNMYAPAEYQVYTYEQIRNYEHEQYQGVVTVFTGCKQQLEAPTMRKDALAKVQEQLKNLGGQ